MEKIKYGDWSVHPEVIHVIGKIKGGNPVWKNMTTKHEGEVLYFKFWNFWVRAGPQATINNEIFFRDYETANVDTDALLSAIGFQWKKAETEEEIWDRIGMVWNWLKANVQENGAEYSTISSNPNAWPSIIDYAKYFVLHGKIVWAACFSKAHLFATLLGRIIYPRHRFGIAQGRHAEGGVTPIASHVFVGVYVSDRWFYLDPTAVPFIAFPDYAHRASIGVFSTVDYEHPFDFLPVPLSGFVYVPHLT